MAFKSLCLLDAGSGDNVGKRHCGMQVADGESSVLS